ncbi:hypothetical protein HZS61_003073 [Fusarium oxysporum f. sp. conglutinans]|nr:hypothetical protein HZS61_003073 [Fusarium oxysporum f. sp. conglutinans]KAG6989306.1 hypothetical protein FocnCong_v020995 [Fusarium oxysporum f. sp. conglutinans]
MQPATLLAFLVTLTATSHAFPAEPGSQALDLEKRRCPTHNVIGWQGGGCEWDWGNDCKERCRETASQHGCCPRTWGHRTDNAGCAWGWQTCQCYCDKA